MFLLWDFGESALHKAGHDKVTQLLIGEGVSISDTSASEGGDGPAAA